MRNCQICKYLILVNETPVYAICKKNNWIFKRWEQDARMTTCNHYEEIEKSGVK